MESKVIWLNDLTESNDSSEVVQTFGALWESIKKRLLISDLDTDMVNNLIPIIDRQYEIEILIDKPYGACFCKEHNKLTQWLEYGDKTKGIVLGFDIDWFDGLKQQMPHPSVNLESSIGYDHVLYYNSELEDAFFNICYKAIQEYGMNSWIMAIRPTFKHYSAFIKNNAFVSENELRVVYYPNEKHEFINSSFNIGGPHNEPFTHYSLSWTKGNGDNAIKAIGLGSNCSLNKNDIKSILENAGVSGEFQLFESQIPYRIR